MTSTDRIGRRRFVQATGVAAVSVTLAGCAGDDDGPDAGGNGDDAGSSNDGSEGGSDDDGDTTFLDDEPDYGGWFDTVDNYDGTVDATGHDEVTVAVGAEGGLSYSPAAVAVSPGTTVIWEWTGEGGAHDVAAEDDSFQSENVDQEGFTFEHTFDEAGVFEYVCTPHEAVGMKGAVVVQ